MGPTAHTHTASYVSGLGGEERGGKGGRKGGGERGEERGERKGMHRMKAMHIRLYCIIIVYIYRYKQERYTIKQL